MAGEFSDETTKLETLRSHQKEWVDLPIQEKVSLLEKLQENLKNSEKMYCEEVQKHKKSSTPQAEFFSFAETYSQAVKKDGKIEFQPTFETTMLHNQICIPVLPWNSLDKLAYMGFEAEIRIQENEKPTQGKELNEADPNGKVALILGAGNQSSLSIADALYKLYNCNEVVMVKHNPVNEWIYPIYEKVMEPFIKRGFFMHCKGGIPTGTFLLQQCDSMHITGSDRAYDAIVWGKGDKTDPNTQPVFTKQVTSELGCVTPWIIVPGEYSKEGLYRLATEAAGAVANNCSFNCIALKVLVTSSTWKQRNEFLDTIRRVLSFTPSEYPYYPGAKERWDKFNTTYSNLAETFSTSKDDSHLPYLFIPNVPFEKGQLAFTMEAFSPILFETTFDDGGDTTKFLEASVNFCNENMWGNLSASVFIPRKTEAEHNVAFTKAIKDLKYGTVSINHWTALAFIYGTPWGGYPGNPVRDIQSGQGFVHNFLLLDNVEKTVTRCPLELPLGLKQPTSPDSKNSEDFYEAMTKYETDPGISALTSISWNAMWN